MELEGWKLLLLVRLSPLVPYNLLNLAMAATKIHFWAFAFVSFFGAPPVNTSHCWCAAGAYRQAEHCNSHILWCICNALPQNIVINDDAVSHADKCQR